MFYEYMFYEYMFREPDELYQTDDFKVIYGNSCCFIFTGSLQNLYSVNDIKQYLKFV